MPYTVIAPWPWGTQTATSQTSIIPAWTNTVFLPSGAGALYYHSLATTTNNLTGYAYANFVQNAAYAQAYQANLRTPPRPLARPALLSGRRALRRSVELYQRLRPASEIRAFLEGRPVTFRGHRFDYRVRKSRNVLDHTINPDSPHVPYDLHILDREGRPMAKGCIVAPGTPVIDQLLALALHISDPDEELVVINTTNWSPHLSAAQRIGRQPQAVH